MSCRIGIHYIYITTSACINSACVHMDPQRVIGSTAAGAIGTMATPWFPP